MDYRITKTPIVDQPAPKPTDRAQLAHLTHKILDVENALLLGGGVTNAHQLGQVRSAKRLAAVAQVKAGLAMNLRSALRSLQNTAERLLKRRELELPGLRAVPMHSRKG